MTVYPWCLPTGREDVASIGQLLTVDPTEDGLPTSRRGSIAVQSKVKGESKDVLIEKEKTEVGRVSDGDGRACDPVIVTATILGAVSEVR